MRLTTRWSIAFLGISGLLVAVRFLMLSPVAVPHEAEAATCDFSYGVDWTDPSTYTVTCGEVTGDHWLVSQQTCTYFSPLFSVGGLPAGPSRTVDVVVRINQSGNLDGNDTAWVWIYVNGMISKTDIYIGMNQSAVFITSRTITVPSAGNFQVKVTMKNDKNNEKWQIKKGDVTICLQSLPLPVSLIGFECENTGADNMLSWTTGAEVNNDYFTLEHSANGFDFSEITRITGAGTSSALHRYNFVHINAAAGPSWYRLSQTDFDGRREMLRVIRVNDRLADQDPVPTLTIVPNPVISDFQVESSFATSTQLVCSVLSMDGREVMTQSFPGSQGNLRLSCRLPENIPAGVYLLRLTEGRTLLGTARIVCAGK